MTALKCLYITYLAYTFIIIDNCAVVMSLFDLPKMKCKTAHQCINTNFRQILQILGLFNGTVFRANSNLCLFIILSKTDFFHSTIAVPKN